MNPPVHIILGDVIGGLRTLPDSCVHCVVTSPPYWGLRDYGVDGQIGLEETPAEYLERMVAVFHEVRRVLRDDGTCWVNMGDTYNGYMANQRATSLSANNQHARPEFESGHGLRTNDVKSKDLLGMPWRLAFALQADGWWLRSDIIWAKPNPMPESVTDRPTKGHEYIFLLTKSARYFYDAEAVKETSIHAGELRPSTPKGALTDPERQRTAITRRDVVVTACRNLRTVWSIATQAYPDAHFATFPEAIPERCIKAGTSEKGCCPACGAPWVRVVDVGYENPGNRSTNGPRSEERKHQEHGTAGFAVRLERQSTTTGWRASCECNTGAPVPCVVLDPFLGSGTTVAVARKLGRHGVGCELNPAYIELARERIGKAERPNTYRSDNVVDSPLWEQSA